MTTTSREIQTSMVMPVEIRPTTRHTYLKAAQVLSRAFVDDPVTVAVYNNISADRRIKALVVDFTAEELECIRRGCPVQANNGSKTLGAAVIYPPGAYPLPVLDQWVLLLKSIWGNGFYDIASWMMWLNEVDKLHPAEPHYYLEYIGVEPECQGMGVGSAILQHLCDSADAQDVGCYLENANPINTALYQRYGFQIMHKKEIIGIPTWFMWRPAGRYRRSQ
jgi:ribosomal protein S18 acetylase RimI-like enzyme